MSQSDKTVRDGVLLIASYHFLLATLSLVGVLAIVIYSIMPAINGASTGDSIFLPIVGLIIGLFLCAFYAITGFGLISLKNSARMSAVFLALFGTIGGLFILIGAGVPTVNRLLPDMASVAGVIIGGLCGYTLLTVLDMAVLAFLFNRRVRALFYGEPYIPEPIERSLGHRFRSAFGDELLEEEYEPEPVRPAVQKQAVKRETPVQREAPVKRETPVQREAPVQRAAAPVQRVAPAVQRTNPPEELDAPGELFTEPILPKK